MRYQRGQIVSIDFNLTALPDSPPLASISDPSAAPFGEFPIPYSGTPNVFRFRLRLPGGATLGSYQVAITYSVAGTPGSVTSSFDVVAGGDSGGEVISLYAYNRPEARFVLAQLGSGKLVQGRNPHL